MRFFILAIIFLSACLCSCVKEVREGGNSSEIKTVLVQFESDNSLFPNPERGLYTHRGYTSDQKPITVNELQKLRADNLDTRFHVILFG
jgi:hypothetical protein